MTGYIPKIGSGQADRFDQRYTMFNRPRDTERSDPAMLELGRKHYGVRNFTNKAGYTLPEWAFAMGCWYLERWWGFGNIVGDDGLYKWSPDLNEIAQRDRIQPGQRVEATDPVKMTRLVKRAAMYMGASAVGVCRINTNWIYSQRFHPRTLEHTPLEIPEDFRYALIMVHEMDYNLMKTAPTYLQFATTGRGYSMMAFVASSVAHFIRDLGYQAIPSGNDTALSIPMAIEAGLGELGRHGLLITPKFGPRIRISKVFTDLPLSPDKPVDFGVRNMCRVCMRCAKSCPGQAISYDEPTTQGPSVSNNHGIYKWYIDPEKCFEFWVKNKGDCAICIRTCVFNKPDNLFHDFVKWHVRNLPQFDRFYLWMDEVCGYGRLVKPEVIWN